MEYILLVWGILCCTQVSSQEAKLESPSDVAVQVSKSAVFYCHVVREDPDDSNSTIQYDKPYIVNWTFTPLGNPAARVIVTWTYHANKSFTNLTSHPEKYGDSKHIYLQIKNVNFSDAGSYGCWSNVTEGIKKAELYVVGYPSCRNEKPTTQTDQEVKFDCNVQYAGLTEPKIYWQHGDTKLNSTKLEVNASSIRAYLSTTATRSMHGHIYNCKVTYPKIFTAVCQALPSLKVYDPAHVSHVWSEPHPRSRKFPLKTHIQLNCVAFGYPVPFYTWYFAPRDNITKFRRITTNSFYKISQLKASDEGLYRCFANNNISGVAYNDSKDINITLDANALQNGKNAAYTIAKHDEEADTVANSGSTLQTNVTNIERDRIPYHARRYKSIFSPYAIGALISASLAVLLIIVFVVLAMKMKKRERKMREKISRAHDEMLDDQEVELLDESLQQQPEFMPTEYSKLRMSWEIARRDIRLVEQIGKGSYVEVWKGRMRRQPGSNDILRVAIKKLVLDCSEGERRLFVSELEVMKMLPAHMNTIRLIGSYTASEPWLIMLEFAPEGTLQEYLQRHRPGEQEVVINHTNNSQAVRLQNQSLDPHKLLALAAQVASGLDHLQRFKLIYYRLKASRVLVGKGGICKLSGFGFPQEIAERNAYEVSSAPIRWLAPECLTEKIYNVKTDVWAYGIVLWEALHFGMTPYPTMGPQEVLERVQSGYRMPQPQHCSPHLFNLMSACWHGNPEDRPTYSQIVEALSELAQDQNPHVMFEKLPDYLKTADSLDDSVS